MTITESRSSTRRDDVLRALDEMAGVVREVVDPRQLASQVAKRARLLLDADASSVYVWNEAARALGSITGEVGLLSAGQAISDQAFAQQRPVLLPTPDGQKCTAAAVPLTVGKRTLGVLAVQNEQPRMYTPEDLRILLLLAGFVAPALDRARWQAESESQRQSAAEQSERLTNILQQLPSGVIVLDSRGYVVVSNPAVRRMCDIDIHDDRPWADQVAGYISCDPAGRCPLTASETPAARVLAGDVVQDTELLVWHADRNIDFWIRVDGVPLRDLHGRISGAVLLYTDVTRERTLARDLAATALEHAKLLGKLADRKDRLERLADQVAEPRVQANRALVSAQLESLTERDRDIVRLLARGLTNKEIGAALHLSAGTVRNRVGRLLTKLGATDRTQAAVIAVTHGLLESE